VKTGTLLFSGHPTYGTASPRIRRTAGGELLARHSLVKLILKILAALAACLASALLTAQATGIYHPAHPTIVFLIAITALVALASSVIAAIAEFAGQIDRQKVDRMDFLLSAAMWNIADTTGIDPRDLGLAIYVRRRERLVFWRERLIRLHRVRAVHRRYTANVVWRPGKGVIGMCVATGMDYMQNTEADYGLVANATREEWDSQVPDKIKNGLSYDEFKQVRGKYGAVIATPIIDDSTEMSRTVGCVSLDGPSADYRKLVGADVRAALAEAALGVARLVL
jgi:hypothetical protein